MGLDTERELPMKALLVILALLSPAVALAQGTQVPTMAQRFQSVIANLIGENVELSTRLDIAAAKIAEQAKQIEDLKKELEAKK